MFKLTQIVPLVAGCLFFVGCSEAPSGPPTGDIAMIESFVTEVPDRATSKKLWQETFSSGSAPEDSDAYKMLQIEPQDVSVEGTSATVKVEITSADSPSPSEPLEWTLEKSGEDWKLKSAPIP